MLLATHSWRNWQTRKTKDLVVNPMQVQLLLSAPRQTEFEPQIRIRKRGCGLCRKKVKVKRR